jgi:hypothetical protein
VTVSLPPTTIAARDPMSFVDYWACLNSHAALCESIAKEMLIAEGATSDEIEEIFRNPDEWVARHGHHFNEFIATRDAMGADYNPLKDEHPQRTMRALNSRAAVQTISAVSQLFHFQIAQNNIDVFSMSASVLSAWNLLFVAGTELATGERAFAVVQAPQIVGAKGGHKRWSVDPKTTQKVVSNKSSIRTRHAGQIRAPEKSKENRRLVPRLEKRRLNIGALAVQ